MQNAFPKRDVIIARLCIDLQIDVFQRSYLLSTLIHHFHNASH